MRVRFAPALALFAASIATQAQEIVAVPASEAKIGRPDDLFNLPPGQWHMAKSLALGSEPCLPDQCEAGFNGGNLVVSVEHAKNYVLIIAGFAMCDRTAYSEVEVGAKPSKARLGHVRSQMKRVVKGLAKTCKMTAPEVPKLEVAQLFPKPPE